MRKLRKTISVAMMVFCLLVTAIGVYRVSLTQVQAAVRLNTKKITLYEGDSTYIYLVGAYNGSIKYSSSNKKVAKVTSKGKIVTKKKGTAVITAKYKNKKYKCKVTVKYTPTEKDISTTEYMYKSYGYYYHFIFVTNNSNETISVTTKTNALDSSGNVIGVDGRTEHAIGAGCTTVIKEYFTGIAGVTSFDTSYDISVDKYYSSVIQNIDYTISNLGNRFIMTVTNNGSTEADFLEAHVFLFKNGEIVDFEEQYFTNSSYSINAGETITEQLDFYVDSYDYYEVYFTGRN